jgi:hypothetical protein
MSAATLINPTPRTGRAARLIVLQVGAARTFRRQDPRRLLRPQTDALADRARIAAEAIDVTILKRIVAERLGDLGRFVAAVVKFADAR